MVRNLAVLNSDSINRKRIKFTVGALEDAIFKNCLAGIPSLLGHDGLQPIGWNFPFGLYMEPKLTRLIGEYQIAENEVDQAIINKAYRAAIAKRYHEECEPHREAFEGLIKEYQTIEGRYIGLGCAAYRDKNILNRVYPFLTSELDDDGLIFLDVLLKRFEYLGQGIFKDRQQDLSIFCHQYFRRNLSHINNFHFEFLDRFMTLQKESGIRLRIALDNNLIGLASSFHMREELEYSWGPKYTDEITNIRLGVTHFKCDDRQKLFSGISGMQFWWKKDDHERLLEAEELRDNPTEGSRSDRYGCRYVHSIYDTAQGKFGHFDGAIRMYDTNGMIGRLEKQINKAGKNSIYTKLFRIDGNLELSRWKSLITFYFQGNPLTYEYFGLKEQHEKLFEGDHPAGNKPLVEQYVPYRMDSMSGLRLFLSYHKPTVVTEVFDRIVINPDCLTLADGNHETIEFFALEVKKALNRIGELLTIPSNIKFVSTKDLYINFPTILHSQSNVYKRIQGTIDAYLSLFTSFVQRNPTVSLTLAWPLEDKEIRLSIFGKVTEIIKWFGANRNIPVDYAEFRKWVEAQNRWLSKTYDPQFNKHDLFDLVSGDGVISIRRKIINHDWIRFVETDIGLEYELTIPKEHDDLLNACKEGLLRPAIFFVVEKVLCSKTGEDYFLTTTSKVLDADVGAVVTEAGPLGAFWTDSAEV